jgi:6-phosphogluconolactonase
VEIRVEADPAEEAARLLAESARRGGPIALSGGSTPRPAYERAARLEPDWNRVNVFFADERCVAPEDERSNYRLVRETLGATGARIHRIRGELDPEEAAARYDAELRGISLDLALMGIGEDGHTASLFPGAPALEETERRAVAAEAGLEPFVPRVTLTLPVLNEAQLVVFLVTGAAKAGAVARAFRGEPGPETPASLIRGASTLALLDAGAAHDI